jgi:hypothetical protein
MVDSINELVIGLIVNIKSAFDYLMNQELMIKLLGEFLAVFVVSFVVAFVISIVRIGR